MSLLMNGDDGEDELWQFLKGRGVYYSKKKTKAVSFGLFLLKVKIDKKDNLIKQ